MTAWKCKTCGAVYSEYVNGCPKCWHGTHGTLPEPEIISQVSLVTIGDEPADKPFGAALIESVIAGVRRHRLIVDSVLSTTPSAALEEMQQEYYKRGFNDAKAQVRNDALAPLTDDELETIWMEFSSRTLEACVNRVLANRKAAALKTPEHTEEAKNG